MSSLADLPELVGFFSYSREDDADSFGALSALRSRIQAELRGQLGRTAKTFRLWQDKEAIPSGTLWETEIRNAVGQSAFFIPIITPTVVSSSYCRFELDAFLGREAALGRSDLVFPILYIDVPALHDSARRENNVVLSLIARRQYFDWREFRYLDINATEVRQAVGRFCTHIRDALQRPWASPQERKRQEEIEAQQRVEEERRRQEAQASRQAEEDAKRERKRAQAERIAEERRRQEAEAKQRAEEDERRKQAEIAARQRADEERRAGEAEARKRAVDERRPGAERTWQPSRRAMVLGAGVLGAGAVATLAVIASRQEASKPGANPPAAVNPSPGAGARAAPETPAAPATPPNPSAETAPRAAPETPAASATAPSRTLKNGAPVWAAGFSPDGKLIASTFANSVKLWNIAGEETLGILNGPTDKIRSVAFSPDGKLIAATSDDHSVTVWTLADKQRLWTLSGHADKARCIAYSADGRWMGSGDHDGSIILRHAENGQLTHTISEGVHIRVLSLAFSPDGRWIASGAIDSLHPVAIWDVESGDRVRSFTYLDLIVAHSVAFSPDGKWIAAGLEKVANVWDAATGKLIHTLRTASDTNSVAFSPNGARIAAGIHIQSSRNETFMVWDARTGEVLRSITSDISVFSVAFSPDGKWIAVGDASGTIALWPSP
jgi:hypothetical protein